MSFIVRCKNNVDYRVYHGRTGKCCMLLADHGICETCICQGARKNPLEFRKLLSQIAGRMTVRATSQVKAVSMDHIPCDQIRKSAFPGTP